MSEQVHFILNSGLMVIDAMIVALFLNRILSPRPKNLAKRYLNEESENKARSIPLGCLVAILCAVIFANVFIFFYI